MSDFFLVSTRAKLGRLIVFLTCMDSLQGSDVDQRHFGAFIGKSRVTDFDFLSMKP